MIASNTATRVRGASCTPQRGWVRLNWLILSALGLMLGRALAQVPAPAAEPPLRLPVHDWDHVADLPAVAESWAGAWTFVKRLKLTNTSERPRRAEPVEVEVVVHDDQVADPAREVRVARLGQEGPVEVPSQICCVVPEDGVRRARLFFLANVPARGDQTYLVLYGNAAAAAPAYDTDLSATGDGYGLSVDNRYFRAQLAPSNGNLKSLFPKGGQAAFVGAGPPMAGGHGVEGTIHWGPDWSDERVGRYRLTSWDGPPLFDYGVVRGPICVRVRRRGHPILSLGPEVGRPHKVSASVIYTFWAGQPYFVMESTLEVLEDARFRDCRNDEFVLGGDLPEMAWMGPDGDIGLGPRGWGNQDPRWMTYFSRATGEGFGSVHLAFENTNPDWDQPATVSIGGRGIWVRYPVLHAAMRAGDRVHERNAYVLHRFEEGGPHKGFADLVGHQERLLQPLEQAEATPLPKVVSVANVMDALRATNEFELYVRGSPWGAKQLSFVDIGVVRGVSIHGNDIRLDFVMPYAGRETWFGWFADEAEKAIRARLREVGAVDVRLVREPKWSPEEMTQRARRAIGTTE